MGLAVYISPLKALINDQWTRLESLAESLEIPVTPWHGDIAASRKTKFFKRPCGCVLITPESMEAMLMRQGSALLAIFSGLRYIVIDELHSFMGAERGKQLQSQLHRIDRLLDRSVPRIGLSATLGDMAGAQDFLRQGHGPAVVLIEAKEGGQELKVLIRGVQQPAAAPGAKADEVADAELIAKSSIALDLFKVLRGSNNLIFPNSRSAVEFFADRLRRCCEEARVPNEFWPHHGNLSKEIREQTEEALKQKERPASAICTSTLELGIDIGSVKSVTQIGPPPSVASLRQRLGRSGRRKGESAILRGYVIERQLTLQSDLADQLRCDLVQTIAMVRLLTRGWYEPIGTEGLHASTLVQQLLSLLAQFGGAHASALWDMLCARGAFPALDPEIFGSLLRGLGAQEIIFQDPTGLILLAPKGERLVEHYTFYAAFSTREEFRVVTAGRLLGSMPVTRPLAPGGFVIFGGRRWEVVSVSQEELVIEVRPGGGGALPNFEGDSGAMLHTRVREEMRAILQSDDNIPFLDATAQKLLKEGRDQYHALNLDRVQIRAAGATVQILPWKGDRIVDTLTLMLQARKVAAENDRLYIEVKGVSVTEVLETLREMLAQRPPSALEIAATVQTKIREKWDEKLPEDVLNVNFAAQYLDVPGTLSLLADLVSPSSRSNARESRANPDPLNERPRDPVTSEEPSL
ncbi:MAG: box helicase [Verrucomicrobia bacterium]|nr:box helicase [Verrucomicrobiota bacterium]